MPSEGSKNNGQHEAMIPDTDIKTQERYLRD